MTEKVIEGHHTPVEGLERLQTVLGRDADAEIPLIGVQTPRIHTPLNDLPSRGHELVDLASSLKIELLEWQKFALVNSHKVKPDGRWQPQSIALW